ncbi:hypothetical protein HYC85_018010 [Camellia sinensis]|uniref:alpha,alpha-trehalose-phosphate synthase (UDP-forming) n=1 Tax=Camellia sinensis TaxID=4442 RepID=A0A7J7GT33_CAMSI|nr:hypothetical protein HYC85_018010 [Camellia sinensis]
MMSRSYTNLLDLASGNIPVMGHERKSLLQATTVAGVISKHDDDQANNVAFDVPSSVIVDRVIIVANQLPVKAKRRPDNKGWVFIWDEDSLLLHIKDGLPDDMEVIYVGSLRVEVDSSEQDHVSQLFVSQAFLPQDILAKFYHGFCKQHLWPLFHYMLPLSGSYAGQFDRSLWEAYVAANKIFSQKVIEVINPEDDYVWIHDYHLMVLPTFLRRRFNRLRMGFFLHSPFPSSEMYRTLPVREEILKALLNSDLIGFHTFDYARHFLSCCSRMLGLEYLSKRGYIGLEYYGRTIGIKIMPVGIHMGQMESVLRLADEDMRVQELKQQFEGKTILLGVDDMDIFKGVNLKLLAMEQMFKQHPNWQGKAILVQIANPARGRGKDLEEIQAEIQASCKRINQNFGQPVNEPAYYTIAECVVVTALRDGMNLTPYEYIVCRQGISSSNSSLESNGPKKSMIVLSEFMGCSPSLSGAIRVNPWNVKATAEALNEAISMADAEKQLRHEKHYRYHTGQEASSKIWKELAKTILGDGVGLLFVALDPNFRKLTINTIVSTYSKAKSRAILFDYDGTVMPETSINKSPNQEVISIINTLCDDVKNTTFLVSGRGKDSLGKWFSSCKKLGIAAEHGYFIRWFADKKWEICGQGSHFGWVQMAKPIMELYTEATDGSYIETKESALVWHHRDADPSFGSSQAKEMLDHLESVLANEPVTVKSGQFIVEVKPQINTKSKVLNNRGGRIKLKRCRGESDPQGVSKGLVAEKIFASMAKSGRQADFVLCIGDDRSDEDMFEIIGNAMNNGVLSCNTSVFACTVGQKPSKAKYYLDDTSEEQKGEVLQVFLKALVIKHGYQDEGRDTVVEVGVVVGLAEVYMKY